LKGRVTSNTIGACKALQGARANKDITAHITCTPPTTAELPTTPVAYIQAAYPNAAIVNASGAGMNCFFNATANALDILGQEDDALALRGTLNNQGFPGGEWQPTGHTHLAHIYHG
jgi:hypothetical protein